MDDRPRETPRPVAPDELGAYVVEPLAARDVDAVARVHVASFGDSFLATLGAGVLRHYFRAFLDYPGGCGFVCRRRDSGEVVAFVCGTEDVALHYRVFLRRRLPPAVPAIAARALSRPRLVLALLARLGRLARVAGGGRGPGTAGVSAEPLPPASLMTIGVHPDHRRHGIGELLVRAFTGEMARRGVRRLKLGVREDNAAARRLYERLGWRPAGGGMYVRDLDAAQAGSRAGRATRDPREGKEHSWTSGTGQPSGESGTERLRPSA